MNAQDLLRSLPESPLTRAEFRSEFASGETPEGNKWQLTHNYQCEGPYGPDQQVTVLNATLTVWSPRHLETATRSLYRDSDFDEALRQAREEVEGLCAHPNAREMSSEEARAAGRFTGNCYHNYECPDCGKQFSVDSSD